MPASHCYSLGFVEGYVVWLHSCYRDGFFFSLDLEECFESGQIPSLIICDKDKRCVLENYFQPPYLSWSLMFTNRFSFPDEFLLLFKFYC